MPKRSTTKGDESVIALQALTFIASETERLERFLALTGLGPDDVRARAEEPDFLAGVLDHLLADESLLLAFCAEAGLAPEVPARARAKLEGKSHGE
jgi:hypothetical protein